MRIGIDCRSILNPDGGEFAGVGHYTYYLVKHLIQLKTEHEFVLFFDYRMKREGTQEFEADHVKIRYFPFSQYKKFLPFAYSHMLRAAVLLTDRLDVYHSPTTAMPLTYPKTTVVTVHDMAIYENPSWFPTRVFSTKMLVPQTLKRARKIIAVSKFTKQETQNLFSVPSRKIVVVNEGVDTRLLDLKDRHTDVRKKFGLGKRFLFFVGTVEARKNLLGLIEAFDGLLKAKPELLGECQLVLAGAIGHHGEEIVEKIQALKLQKRIRYLGYVTHNQKLNLMKAATAFVFPSLYEGFGLPVLEAMNLGTPVVTSNVTALPELAGDAAVLVDPANTVDLAAGIERVLSDEKLRQTLRTKGLHRAKAYGWSLAARETVGVYESIPEEKLIEEARKETGS
ncbi:MAG: glycosyltransferase family 4 protein [Candidatus Kerfeldbacteria bacterium]|nr:glycosyltransferase family 4 protein [Candidatus Kerfeldbacteria bacterium]